MSDIFPPRMSIEGQLTAAADRIKKLEAQLAELNSPVVLSEWQEQQVRIAELEAQLVTKEQALIRAANRCVKAEGEVKSLQSQVDSNLALVTCGACGSGTATSNELLVNKRIAELEAQLAETNATIKTQHNLMVSAERRGVEKGRAELESQVDRVDELQAQLTESEEIIVCLQTDMPMAERLLNQRGTINKLEAKLTEYHKQIPHLLRFVPPQNHDPLCRLHNDAVDYLLDSIKGEDS